MSSPTVDPQSLGKVLVVWSAPGSVGRSQIAAAVATNLAELGQRTILIDADVIAPAQLQIFGFAENHVGLASACRLAARNELDALALESACLEYQMSKDKLTLLPGLHLVSRWPELGFEPMQNLIRVAQQTFDFVVVDVAAPLERELVDQRTLAERYAVTHAALNLANQIIGICNDDPISVARYVWAVQELKQLGASERLITAINRSRASGQKARGQIEATLHRLAGIRVSAYLADDPELFSRAAEAGVPISLAPRNSPTKQALNTFVRSQLLGLETSARRLAKLG